MYSFPETREQHNMQLYDSVTKMCHNEVGSTVTFCKTQPLKKNFLWLGEHWTLNHERENVV